MARKYELITDLYYQTINEVSENADSWKSFLKMAWMSGFGRTDTYLCSKARCYCCFRNREMEQSFWEMGQ